MTGDGMDSRNTGISWRSIGIGAFFVLLFSVVTVFYDNTWNMLITASQVAVLPYVLLLLLVLLINPLCRLLRGVRRFTVTEILVIFMMGAVSAGISTSGLVSYLLPVSGSLFNQSWNTGQSGWDRHVVPHLNERFFVSVPGIRQAAQDYAVAETRLEAVRRGEAAGPVEVLEAERDDRRAALRELEVRAFAKVELYRRGLGDGKRAYPGIFPLGGDDGMTYRGRWRRLVHGIAAKRHVRTAMRLLPAPGAVPPDGSGEPVPVAVADRLRRAADALQAARRTGAVEARAASLEASLIAFSQQRTELQNEVLRLGRERRSAPAAEDAAFETRIERAAKEGVALAKRIERIRRDQERVDGERDADMLLAAASAELRDVAAALSDEPGHGADANPRERLIAALARFPAFDASLRRHLLGDIPWSDWTGPLLNWGFLIGLAYLVMMSVNLLIHRQWARNEKLVYPLAEMTEMLAGAEDGEAAGTRLPALFRSGLFWSGFLLSALVLGWNIVCHSGAVPGLAPFDLANLWRPYIENTPLEALDGRSTIIFTVVSLSFLMSAKISFSLWFFWVFYMGQLLMLVWLGHGVGERSFPSDWIYTLNFRTSQGGGALMVFAAVLLWKCRRYLFCALKRGSLAELETDERRELHISSFIFVIGSVALVAGLWLGLGANLYYAVFTYLVAVLVMIGAVRGVAEAGILGLQAWVSPFHFIRTLFGMDRSWTSPHLFAPLFAFYSMLFVDIKTFIAPAMANCIKIREDLRMQRGRFHLALFLAITVAAFAAVVMHLMMAYDKGADQMYHFYCYWVPKALADNIGSMVQTPPVDTTANRVWFGFGAALMGALLYGRQFLFWLPHPLGMIMLVNRLMHVLWFSVFLGWACKTAVSRYGSRAGYHKARGFFIGLIAGELAMALVSMLVTACTGIRILIPLNIN